MVKLRRKLDSETLHLPELKPLIGRIVEITIEEQAPEVREEFCAEAARLPESEEEFEAQKAIYGRFRLEFAQTPIDNFHDGIENKSSDWAG